MHEEVTYCAGESVGECGQAKSAQEHLHGTLRALTFNRQPLSFCTQPSTQTTTWHGGTYANVRSGQHRCKRCARSHGIHDDDDDDDDDDGRAVTGQRMPTHDQHARTQVDAQQPAAQLTVIDSWCTRAA